MPSLSPAHYCTRCLGISSFASEKTCPACGGALSPLFDARGALTSAFLKARGFCCDNGCSNCPYKPGQQAAVKE